MVSIVFAYLVAFGESYSTNRAPASSSFKLAGMDQEGSQCRESTTVFFFNARPETQLMWERH